MIINICCFNGILLFFVFYSELSVFAEGRVIVNMTDSVKKKKKRSPALAAAIILLFVIISVLIFTLAFFTSFDEITNVFNSGRIDIILTEPKWKPEKAKNIVPSAYLDKDPYITNNEDVPVYVFLKVTVPAVKYDYDSVDSNKGSIVTLTGDTQTGYLPLYKFVTINDNGTPDNKTDDTKIMDTNFNYDQQINNTKWVLLNNYPKLINSTGENAAKTAAYEYVFYYKGDLATDSIIPLNSGQTTAKPLFDQIYLQNFRNTNFSEGRDFVADRNYGIKVEAYGIQADYLSFETNDASSVWALINGNS